MARKIDGRLLDDFAVAAYEAGREHGWMFLTREELSQ